MQPKTDSSACFGIDKRNPTIYKSEEAVNRFRFIDMETLKEIYSRLQTRSEGLSDVEVQERLQRFGKNSLKPSKRGQWFFLLLSQFKSPLILLLIGAAILSFSLGAAIDSSVIFAIVLLSGLLGFFQEKGALKALSHLLSLVSIKIAVLRNGQEIEVPMEEIVPGDIVYLRSGDTVPADCILIDANKLVIGEAVLTGESLPTDKIVGDPLFLGTIVISGIGIAVAELTGKKTRFGQIAEDAKFKPPATAFEVGVRKFGELLLIITLVVTTAVFAFNTWLNKPLLDSLLFALAIAVGLTPQLLPAVISVNLSHGARNMAKKQVIIKRLASIENFGQMDILCCDKTGTLTEGQVELSSITDCNGNASEKCNLYAYLNAHFQSGYLNPLDKAILKKLEGNTDGWEKTDEIPYDFTRKRISTVFSYKNQQIMITKGAFSQTIAICNRIEKEDGSIVPIESNQASIDRFFTEKSSEGKRVLGLAYGNSTQEENLIFLGFLIFSDPIKPNIDRVISDMKRQGVALKIITGDRHEVAMHVAGSLGLSHATLVTGEEIQKASDYALIHIAEKHNVFAEIEPTQKKRIILALRKAGHVVGYLGDGVNDISALHHADVGIAVESGADAAKESADIVLLKKDLQVLQDGILEGRKTFINTMKYVYMASSANFGNMLSMSGASFFLKFLPMLPKQVLLTNFCSDLPEMALATDRVDEDIIRHPVKWDLPSIRRFMIIFGALNSMADYLTFVVLYYWYQNEQAIFQTGWFMENVLSAALIVFSMRTRHFLFRSKPGGMLIFSVLGVALLAPMLPYTPLGELFGLVPLPLPLYGAISAIIIWFFISVEIAKHFFFKNR